MNYENPLTVKAGGDFCLAHYFQQNNVTIKTNP